MQVDFFDPTTDVVRRSVLGNGVYLQWMGVLDGAEAETIAEVSYDAEMADLPAPAEGVQWSGVQTNRTGDQVLLYDLRMSVGSAFTWRLGECVLETLPVSMSVNENGTFLFTEEIFYVTELRAGVLVSVVDPDGTTSITHSRVAVIGSE